MMLFQDGSRYEWLPGIEADLIATMDDADNQLYSAFLVTEEGTMSSLQGVAEVIEAHGLFASLYVDRASHYFFTPQAAARSIPSSSRNLGGRSSNWALS